MKLEGIRVLDLSSFLPGPYVTLGMADHGAEVIKIEAPDEGDPGRHIGLADGAHTVFFRNLNRGKKSVVLDLKAPADREAFLRLVDTADVVVESYRPGVAARLGVDYASVASRNPRIVYLSISAFGQDGPYASRPAHDLAIEAIGGLLSNNLGGDGRPALPAIPIADVTAGLQGLAGVLMALLRRERTGLGDRIDISMHEALVGAMLNVLGPTLAEGRAPDTPNERTTGGAAFYRLYDCADGRQVAIAGQEPKFVRTLLRALGREDLAPLCERGPGPHQAPVVALLQSTFAAMSSADAEAMLADMDVCWGRVATMPEALADPHLAARGFITRDADGLRHIGSPIRFQYEPAMPTLVTPLLDEHVSLVRD
ncbi:CaiB/BaiF CoA transferase family protein [Sphingomonas profundi]|uniref:CaiB/BaiF CoA transferase family protein n=1 Tax=Alterirhizorhabdus profundi TaxID=2681549 RepID=UPI0012E90298|nr:CoA transferase [Sphingomonas profundi]